MRAIEIKLSQGAKPGLGGMLPAAKVTPEIAAIRGVPAGRDCISPARHSAFADVDGLIDVRRARRRRHRAAGRHQDGRRPARASRPSWPRRMRATGGGPDFVTVDGAEGGTGAAPLAFADHVALPFKLGFSRAFAAFAREGLADDVVFIGSGRLGLPDNAVFAFALGCDMVSVGREAMLAIGCIQAQRCHTGGCPTGVATQNRWLMRGLDPDDKHARAANYVRALRAELLSLSRAMGVRHPALLTPDHVELVGERYTTARLEEVFGYDAAWRAVSDARRAELESLVGPPAERPGTTLGA